MSPSSRYGSLALLAAAVSGVAWSFFGAPGPRGIEESPLLVIAFLVAGILAARHRPWGRLGLGIGAAMVAPVALLLGPAATLVVAVGTSASGFLGSGRRQQPRSRRLDDLTRHTLVASLVVSLDAAVAVSPQARTLLILILWTGGLVSIQLLQQRLAGRQQIETWRLVLAALIETVALATGMVLAAVAQGVTVEASLALAIALATLAVEASRQSRLREQAEIRVRAFERLGRAGRRLVTQPSEVGGVAPALYRECRQVLRFDGFELELVPRRSGDASEFWSAGPDGRLHNQPLELPERPPMRPRVPRRVEWQRFEHRLDAGGVDALAYLRLWCDPRRISPDSEELLQQLVPQLGGMVYRALLGEQARTDPLTGTALRRVFDTRLEEAFARSRSSGDPVAIVLCDLDFFKRVNDTYGHAAGDRALVAVASVLSSGLRESDLCSRYGGEEFALVLEGLEGQRVLEVADQIRQRVEALEVPADETDTLLPLTLSAGIAVYPEVHCHRPEELTELADIALYEAKNLGRNGCLLYRGSGRFQDARGRVIETREAGQVEAPHFFA